MIKNERQYRITKSQIAKFESALQDSSACYQADGHSRAKKLERDALQSQLGELREQVHAYERLRSGRRKTFPIASFAQLPQALVQARIAAGLSQKGLADRLGLKEQQIQRYEATNYSSASLTRICEILDSLGAQITGKITPSSS